MLNQKGDTSGPRHSPNQSWMPFRQQASLQAAPTASLGSNSATSEKETLQVRDGPASFQSLPNELHVNIAAHLDSVSQMCLGLTSRRFHNIFHEIMDDDDFGSLGGRKYNIKRRPFELRMRVSVCGAHTVYGWYEYGLLQGEKDITWNGRNLGGLIAGEKSLFRGLERCESCLKYKPDSAYARFGLEVEMAKKYQWEIDALDDSDLIRYSRQCRRCRAWTLLVLWENRAEYLGEPLAVFEERPSLGLRTCDRFEDVDNDLNFKIAIFKKQEEQANLPLGEDYVPWEDIFAKLQI